MTFDEAIAKALALFDEHSAKHLDKLADGLRGEGFSDDEVEQALSVAREFNTVAREEYAAMTRRIVLTVDATWDWPADPGPVRMQ